MLLGVNRMFIRDLGILLTFIIGQLRFIRSSQKFPKIIAPNESLLVSLNFVRMLIYESKNVKASSFERLLRVINIYWGQ